MPKKKTVETVTTIEEHPQEPLAPPIETEEQVMVPGGSTGMMLEPPDEELKKFFSDFGADGLTIKVYKYDPGTNRPSFRLDTDLEGANESFLQQNFGPGKYNLRAYKNGVYGGSRTVIIGEGIAKPATAPAAPAPVINVPTSSDPMIQVQMEMMRQEMQLTRDMFLKMIDKMGDTGGKSDLTELAQAMAILKTAMPQQSPTVSPLTVINDAIPLVKQLIDLGAGREPGEKSEGWPGLIKDAIREIPNVMKGFSAMKSLAPGSHMPPAANPVEIPAAVDETTIGKIRAGLQFLKTRVLKKSPPGVWVDFVMETLDDEQSRQLADLITQPYDQIAQIDPELMSPVYRPWFEQFFAELRNELQQPDASGGTAGDGPDPAGDAGTGPAVVSFESGGKGESD